MMASMKSPFSKTMAFCALVLVLGLSTSVGAVRADQWQPLRDDPRITSGLTVIAVGRRIHDLCPDISARMLRSIAFAEGLVSHARTLGFARSEVNDYIEDRDEQDRYRDIARTYFAQRNASWSDAESLCRVGRDEIAAASAIGRLLR